MAGAVTDARSDEETDRLRVLADVDRPERHVGDIIRILAGGFVLTLSILSVREGRLSVTEASLFRLINGLPTWSEPAFRIVLVAAVVIGIGVPFVALLARHLRLARDTVLAVLGAWGAAALIQAVMERGTPDELLGRSVHQRGIDANGYGFPSPEVAIAAAVVAAAGPYLTRTARRAGWIGVVAIGVARVFVGAHLPVDVVAGLAIGWMAGAAVHLTFGSPGGRPTLVRVRHALAQVDLPIADLTPIGTGPMRAALFTGHLPDGTAVFCRALGRDERNADALDRAWRSVSLRDADETWFSTAGHAIEHEAYLAMRAREVDVGAPDVLATVSFADGAVIAERLEPGSTLADLPTEALDDALLAAIWTSVARLRGAHLAHRSLSASNVLVAGDDVVLLDWSRAIAGASDRDLAEDVVEIVVSLAVRVGAERAVASAMQALGPDALTPVLPLLQPIVLSRETRRELKATPHRLDEVRTTAAAALGVEEPKLQPLTRLRPETILMVVVLLLAIHVLTPQLGEFGEAWQAILQANLAWIAVAIVATALTPVALGLSLLGAIKERLPILWLSVVQLASAFANKLAPGSVGGLALRVRYLQRSGLATEEAVASVALASAGGGVVRVAFILIAVLLAGGSGFGGSVSLPSGWIVLAAVVVIAAVAGVVVFTALGRRLLRPLVKGLADLRDVLRQPSKAALLLGGAVLQTLLSMVAFGVSLAAVHAGASTDTVIVVYIVGTTIGGAAPTPGGLGAVEAALVAGLTAAGIAPDLAVAGVLVFRLVTYWLPIVPGYLSLHALRKRGRL